MTSDGSAPLKNARHERFAQLLASPEKRTATDAWCLSDPAGPAVATKGREVAASRNARRDDVKSRVAFLRNERAQNVEAAEIDAVSVSELMAKVTAKFLAIGALAENLGLSELAQKMRRATTIHAGRAERLHRHVPEVERAEVPIDYDATLARLPLCDCQ